MPARPFRGFGRSLTGTEGRYRFRLQGEQETVLLDV
jgi:protocatechuate 3,4-dioxygenase beta subunit